MGKRLIPILIVTVLMIATMAVYSQGTNIPASFAFPNSAPLDGAIFILLSAGMVYGAKRMHEPE